jgi:hypothetical protein
MASERLAFRPRLDVPRDDLADRRLVRAHALAMERRQHQPPAGQVIASLEQQQRARAEDRQQRERAAGRQAVLGVAVERPDRPGVREHHQRRLEPQEPHAERVAEPAAAGLQEGDRSQQPAQRLGDRRLARADWKGAERWRAGCNHGCSRRYTASIRAGGTHLYALCVCFDA